MPKWNEGKFLIFSAVQPIFSEADSADMVFVYFLPIIVEDNHEHRWKSFIGANNK